MPGWPGTSAPTRRPAVTVTPATGPWSCGTGTAGRGGVVTPPRAYINSPLDQGVVAVAATSGSNAWVLAARGIDEVDYTDALHLTGRQMGRAGPARCRDPDGGRAFPDAAVGVRRTVLVRAARLLRALQRRNLEARVVPVQRHRDRCPFRRATCGSAAAATARPPWHRALERAAGGTPPRCPDLGLPASDLLWANINGLADVGPRDVWADITTANDASANPPGTILLHWNGKAWSRVAFPYAGSASSPVASDGHGGIWLATANGAGDGTIAWFDHYAGGRWTRVEGPERRGRAAGGVLPELDSRYPLAVGGRRGRFRRRRRGHAHVRR